MYIHGLGNNHYTIAASPSGLVAGLQKIYFCVQCIPTKCFNNFLQSAVNARGEGDLISTSGIVGGSMNLLANSCVCYHITDRSQPTVTRYLTH